MPMPIQSSPNAEQPELSSPAAAQPAPLVVVDLDERQSSKQLRRLRIGEGKLLDRIERIVAELKAAGTIQSNAQPVVLIVREELPWPLG